MTGSRSFYSTPLVVLLIAASASYLYGAAFYRTLVVLGVFRSPRQMPTAHVSAIPDTVYCEDLHYHESSGLIFAACEDDEKTRHSWFPPLGIFDDPAIGSKARGSLKVIDPNTLKVKTLAFENFDGPFITHGIDVLSDAESQDEKRVYIFAVNHRPNPQHYEKRNESAPRSHSVVEVFRHEIGSDSVEHVRSVWHPLIRTPNDIYAVSSSSLFVTNDHHYVHGHMKTVEDVYFGATWSDTIFVRFTTGDDDAMSAQDDSHGVQASVALEGLHNNNGLGRGKTSRDILIGSAGSGMLHLGVYADDGTTATGQISVTESIELESCIDNPSYFADPYANSTFDGSGFVLAGLSNGAALAKTARNQDSKDGTLVWMVSQGSRDATYKGIGKGSGRWRKRLLFEDDGTSIRTASSAVLVAKDPATDSGRRRAQLFVSGFLSKNVVMCVVEL
ncbi:hypothetical protein XA68_12639 [Ophiocordyceps unilateralis]|uniref:Serum paraoxonase/arylesterase family protein n=1 Tax=Ophiocordyceps unilateralis TaxID=268505 RepID=A0A2A9PED3_OPHUN|nr:hypothetical protein XA68_12639 [Ophiocordyceps unilateralis]